MTTENQALNDKPVDSPSTEDQGAVDTSSEETLTTEQIDGADEEDSEAIPTIPDPDNAAAFEDLEKGAAEATADAEKEVEEATAAKLAKEAAEDEPDKDTPFHLHPRFKELEGKADSWQERALKAEGKLETGTKPIGGTEKEAGYQNLRAMSEDELDEFQRSDPKGYSNAVLDQAKAEAKAEMSDDLNARDDEAQVQKTVDNYVEANPDFDSMWDSGELKQFMQKHPGHNAMSAHMMIKAEKQGKVFSETEHKEAVAKAIKDTEVKVLKNVKAKREASTLGSTGGSPVRTGKDEVSPEMKDSKKFGGTVAVLARRLVQRRAAAS